MNLNKAEFEAAFGTSSQLPSSDLPEIAFAGRSNVGKSSLLNRLFNRKALARVSSVPGKTATINFYKVDDARFVDLPGYGYAKVSKKTKSVFQQFITDYFENREQLVCAFVLIDIRHEAQKIDIEFMSYMGESEIPFCIIFTKADKISKVKIDSHVAAYKKQMYANNWAEMPHYFVTSSTESIGKEELLSYIDEVNQEVFKNNNDFLNSN